MLRMLATRAVAVTRQGIVPSYARTIAPFVVTQQQHRGSHKALTAEEFDCKYITYFNRTDLDGWELRKGLTEVIQVDEVPDPAVITAALRACRRLNEYALCIRFLESVRFKCAHFVKTFWPYILQEIRPTLDELGIETPEELGYDKPELELEELVKFR